MPDASPRSGRIYPAIGRWLCRRGLHMMHEDHCLRPGCNVGWYDRETGARITTPDFDREADRG